MSHNCTCLTLLCVCVCVLGDVGSLTDGLYELRAKTQCRAPDSTQDPSLYVYTSPLKLARVDHNPPRVFGTPIPAINTWLPGQPISITFTEAVDCQGSFLSQAVARAYVHTGPTISSGVTGDSPLTMLLHCSADGTTINLAFDAPVWGTMSGKLVEIEITNVFGTYITTVHHQEAYTCNDDGISA